MRRRPPARRRSGATGRVPALKRHGQHFLEAAWADKVVEAIGPQATDRFLEIGPGPGAVTLRLAPRVASLTAVEVDARMVTLLAPQLPSNATLVHADVLETDLAGLVFSATRVVGNLPYNISSPILFRLIGAYRQGLPLLDATLMLQREVADRIVAAPGGKEYGVLSILVQLHADARQVLALPPGAFRPAPKVRSSVIRLTFRQPTVAVADLGVLDQMVRGMFTQRRKMLGNALAPFASARGLDAAAALARAGLAPSRRPETLQLAELARLAAVFAST